VRKVLLGSSAGGMVPPRLRRGPTAVSLLHRYAPLNRAAPRQRTQGRLVYAEYTRQLKYAPGLSVSGAVQ